MKGATNTNIFTKHVTVFPSLAPSKDTAPSVRTLGEFLNGGTHYAELISRARELRSSAAAMYDAGDVEGCNQALKQYDAIKMQLPCMIPQGVCPSAHNDGFTSYTDVLCLDIDVEKPGKQPNGNELFDIDQLKHFFASLDYVAYCGLSLGGLGLFVLIPIATHERHADYWRALDIMLKKLGVTIDPATKNIARKRIMSYDPSAYCNEAAEVFRQLPRGEVQHPQQRKQPQRPQYDTAISLDPNDASDEARMKQAAQDAITRRIDMTENYEDWLKLGASIANTLGESGRELYHSLSCMNSGYEHAETDRKYTSLLNSNGGGRGCGFGTFFELCKRNGVTVPKATRHTNKRRTKETRPRVTPHPLAPLPAKPTSKSEGATISPAAKEELMQRAEIITADLIILRDYLARHPKTAQFLQDVDAHYCGGGMIGAEGWRMTNEQFNYLLDKKVI